MGDCSLSGRTGSDGRGLYEQLEIPPDARATSISADEGDFVVDFLRGRPVTATLETGFAFGCSAAYILSATDAPHIAIDPYETNYGNLGLSNIAKLGFADRFELIPLPAHLALPQLLTRGAVIDFAFIDGGHLFEHIIIDWYYIDLLLNINGHVMFHDRWLKATQVVASFITENRSDYREIRTPLPNMYLFEKIGGPERDWRVVT